MSFKNWKVVNWLLHWRFLKASGGVFYFKKSRPSISKYSTRCLYFQLPGQLFYRHFWNLIMKLFCVISDGPYIFCYMLWKKHVLFWLCFLNFLWLKVPSTGLRKPPLCPTDMKLDRIFQKRFLLLRSGCNCPKVFGLSKVSKGEAT